MVSLATSLMDFLAENLLPGKEDFLKTRYEDVTTQRELERQRLANVDRRLNINKNKSM